MRSVPVLHRGVSRLRGRRIHDPNCKLRDVHLGTAYGGWSVDTHRLDASSIIYSIGVGEDVSFDLALIDKLNCIVHAFDPTPISVNWIAKQNLPPNFVFHDVGIAAKDGEVEFHLPPIKGFHSFSISAHPEASQTGTIKCPVLTLSSVMRQLGHRHVDLLKIDIEGFEYQVIDNIIASNIRPDILLIEFHHMSYGIARTETLRTVDNLRRYGYKIYYVSNVGAEYGFVDGILHEPLK